MNATHEFVIGHTKNDTRLLRFDDVVIAWMRQKYANQRNGPKAIAREASYGTHQVSPHTGRSWLKGRTVPTLESIEIMAARCDELHAALEAERARLRELLR